MNITRRIHLNPQSKGNLGKSFEAEFRTAWLDRHGISWNGSDLDDRHHTFAGRHSGSVQSYQLGNELESKTALLKLFRRVLKDAAPVHVIDTRAQADALILGALEELQVLDICADQGLRLTFFLFPTDDTESMTNAGQLFLYAGDIGKAIVERQKQHKWGDQVIDRLSSDLAKEFPQMAGFSRPNLYRMRAFYLGYSQADSIVAQPVRQLPTAVLQPLVAELNAERPAAALTAIPWGQNVILLQKLKDPLLRL